MLASSGLGTALRLETLHGLSGSAVFRVRFARRSVVVKVTSARTEFDFYRITAPALRARGIGIPELISGGTLPDGYWFALEHIPKPLPSARWIADGEQMRTLRRLHRTTLEPPHIGGATFRPEWTPAMTESALAWLPPGVATGLSRTLPPIRHAAQSLFAQECLVCGDPNPRNWGLREDGSLVLFDWERFGMATPAIDVAITMPGLPDPDVLATVATGYLDDAEREARDVLVRQLAIAKVWSAVEFLAGARRRGTGPNRNVLHLCGRIERWVGEMAGIVA